MNEFTPDDRAPDDQTPDRWRHYRSKGRFLGLAPDGGLSLTYAPRTRYYVVDLSPETGEPFIYLETTDIDSAFGAAGERSGEAHRQFAVLSREEALADEVGRQLLARWKANDDAAWLRNDEAQMAMARLQEEIEGDQGLLE